MNARRWLVVAWIGFALVLLGILIVCAAMLLKEQFKGIVGTAFLGTVLFLVLGGGLALLVTALMLPHRKSWRALVIIAWSLIAISSPLMGWLFLMPWGLLLVTAPVVIVILLYWGRMPPAVT